MRRTVTETDVYLFAGLTGDLHPDHMDVTSSVAGANGRIAHGALIIGLMSAASALIHRRHSVPSVSYGYDRVRFVRPVYFGDTVEVEYVVEELDPPSSKAYSAIVCTNQRGEVVAAAKHIIKFLPEATV